jgi:hypothetical protein
MLLIAFSFLAISFAAEDPQAIEAIHKDPWSYLGLPNPVTFLILASFISGLGIFLAIFLKNVSNQAKKIVFAMIAAPIALATVYLGGSTVYLNFVSETGGPVHWHADYEIWACGVKYELADPTGWDNKVGSPTIHEHNDNRIHVEGVLLKKEEASLRNYFIQAGGNFDGTSLTIPTHDGVMTWSDGDKCDGKPAKWYVFVNGEAVENPQDYVISPYTLVPPGDTIKLVFTEMSPRLVDTSIGGPP